MDKKSREQTIELYNLLMKPGILYPTDSMDNIRYDFFEKMNVPPSLYREEGWVEPSKGNNGWPVVSRYIGISGNGHQALISRSGETLFINEEHWQERRVYDDELKELSGAFSNQKLNDAIKQMEGFLK